MIHPSYTELLEVLSKQEEFDNSMVSRYTIIIAAAKRARQITDGSDLLITNVKVDKPVSVAVEELYQSKINIKYHNPNSEEVPVEENIPHELLEISLDNYGNDD